MTGVRDSGTQLETVVLAQGEIRPELKLMWRWRKSLQILEEVEFTVEGD